MTEQLSFFDQPKHGLARWSDPGTSHEAAEQVDVTRSEALVLAAIRRSGSRGLIAAELPGATGLALNGATPRTRPLAEKGLIFDSGERRPAPSGRMQIVWRAICR
jgi:DNA-binding MarR family transcriptional regulator